MKFKWTDTSEQSFRELKRRLEKTPILTILNKEDGFFMYCDTSGRELEVILMRRGRVIANASLQLKDYEKNYPTQDLELTMVIFPLKVWRH